jgi:glycogen debranching enzyme
MILSVPHPLEILYGGGTSLCCAMNGEIRADQLHGFFAGDTRVLSTYRFTIAGHSWRVISRGRPGPSTSQWEMQNPPVRVTNGDLEEGTIHFRLRRRVMGALHDDLTITSFARRPISVRLTFQLDADFADLFQVKERTTPPRLSIQRIFRERALSFAYERRGFRRGLHVGFSIPASTFVGTQAVFDLVLEPQEPWRCCIEAVPELDGARIELEGDPHSDQVPRRRIGELAIDADPILKDPFERGCTDLDRLALPGGDGPPFIAAGAPWFLTLFGRDTLVTSLMAGLLGRWHVEGALHQLAERQAKSRDDYRDAEPGKIAHELRRGELAYDEAIPHTPYYGTHDAPALFVLALWNAYRWTGDRSLLEQYLPAADAALEWCAARGDRDGDGLLEYETRSRRGYRNQGWKDAGDAIVGEDGRLTDLPIATVEMQGYWYAARLAMAELCEAIGARDRAERLRNEARTLRQLIEERFWMEERGCYGLAIDGGKRLVGSISSNPGHLLWCGVPTKERALRTARRLLEADMFSGYGVRTLSADHACYNPLSYQLGSVWPHDTALFAAGLARYGLRDEASRVFRSILEAARMFEEQRLPELFCGFARDEGPPVPYELANVPQAWAAAVPILAAQIFLGLLPDVANGRCHLDPWLPKWLPTLQLTSIEIGGACLEVKLIRRGDETIVEHARHPALEVVRNPSPSPLWGAPFPPE